MGFQVTAGYLVEYRRGERPSVGHADLSSTEIYTHVAIRAEGVFSLAAGVGLPGTHDQGKTETLSKTRVWGFGEKTLPCFRATTELNAELHLRMQSLVGKPCQDQH